MSDFLGDLFLLCTDWVTVFGERFVMMKEGDPTDETAAAPQIVFVQNWVEELQRLVPTN